MWVASDNDNHARSIRTIVLHKLENVEEDGDQMVRKQQQRDEEERRSRRAELARPRAPEPNGIDNHSVINQLFESLNTITNQLQSTVELSSSLQAPHAVAQDTISNFESQVTLFDSIVGLPKDKSVLRLLSSNLHCLHLPPITTTNPPPFSRHHTKVFREKSGLRVGLSCLLVRSARARVRIIHGRSRTG